MKIDQTIISDNVSGEVFSYNIKRKKKNRILVAVIALLVILVATIVSGCNDNIGIMGSIDLPGKKMLCKEYDGYFWQYKRYYAEDGSTEYNYSVITGINNSSLLSKDIIIPDIYEGFDLKNTLELHNKIYFDKATYFSLHETVNKTTEYGIVGCDAVLGNNAVTLFGIYLLELLRDADNIYVPKSAYNFYIDYASHDECDFKVNTANVCQANVSYMNNYYDGFFESPRFFYIPRYEYQDVVKKELKSAETSSQIETIHRRYKSHRFDASRFNNGYYWIDNLNNGDKITTKPENPVRIGYTFAGWCLDKEGTQEFDFDTFVKSDEDLVLYAKWIKNN